jgi:hypothetical protein
VYEDEVSPTIKGGNDINMYLQLLKQGFYTLWVEQGVDTWDTVTEEYTFA